MKNIYSVKQVNTYISNMFKNDMFLTDVSVCGEISNCKYHSTGIYFSLKDEESVIACVIFKKNMSQLRFELQNGMKIIVSGTIDAFIRDGKYQIYVKNVEKQGIGELTVAFEKLKKKLNDKGYFDTEYKRSLPMYPKTIGIVTAPTGAAVRDIISVSKRRNPYIQLVLYPSLVQGDGAGEMIANGIMKLQQVGVDMIIVGRGGGSIEDLWPFNEEIVAEAIFNCEVPVVSAVGHETDFTIADFVADMRAPTPSAAAELSVPLAEEIFERFDNISSDLQQKMSDVIERSRYNLDVRQKLLESKAPVNIIKEYRKDIDYRQNRLTELMRQKITDKYHLLDLYINKLEALSPLSKLNSGMAYVLDDNGRRISDVSGLHSNDVITLRFKDGTARATVNEVRSNKNE